MLLTEQQRLIRDSVRDFARDQLVPYAAEWDRRNTFPRDALRGLGDLGVLGMVTPEDYGGAGLDYVSLAVAIEEVAAGDGATSTIVSVQNSVVCGPINAFGDTAQKGKYLTRLASGEWLGCFCLTEPHVGSDAGALKTTATRDGNDFVLNGVKQFITTGKHADIAIVFAVTDREAGKRGISAFIVETGAPSHHPGFIVARVEDKLGQHASDTAQIVLENLRVPAETCWVAKARATRSRSRTSKAAGSGSRRNASGWPARRTRRRSLMRRNGRASARRSSSIRQSTSGSPTWRPRSRPRGN
jgi:alkylation response protein AidB-like acyl-CoA dehydrogenase